MKRSELLEIAKPILFNTEMVRAILDGRKTETRRVVKNSHTFGDFEELTNDMYLTAIDKNGEIYPMPAAGLWATFEDDNGVELYSSRKAQYEPGDILYVRETWAALSKTEGTVPQIYYKADDKWKETFADFSWCIKWRPSIHMPKEAARIFLKVTDVGVERLRDITVEGFKREGIAECSTEAEMTCLFWDLWDGTMKKADRDKYGWEANPYVWVNKFERLEVEE